MAMMTGPSHTLQIAENFADAIQLAAITPSADAG
jgi:hypothetical protein